MKIGEAIQRADSLKPNSYSQHDKIVWLSNLDMIVYNEVISAHENPSVASFDGYADGTSPETELLVGAPYDDMYISWIAAQIDLNNLEYDFYNNDIARFNETYSQYRNFYNSKHEPKGRRFVYF